MNLRPVIVPAKVLSDGKHRIRIGMSHKGDTRYFLTRFQVDSPNCILGGTVTGVPNASYINQKLMQMMSDIYKAFDDIPAAEYLTCSQLKQRIEEKLKGTKPITLYDMMDMFSDYRKHIVNEGTLRIQHFAFATIKKFFKADYTLARLSTNDLYEFRDFMTKEGLSDTTQSIDFQILRQIVTYALRHDKVSFQRNPFKDFKKPKPLSRDLAISIDELRRVRDCEFGGFYKEQLEWCRDMFMLSFYLCGMNMVDIFRLDFSKDYIKFHRKKTESRRPQEEYTEFTIQPEARAILDKRYVGKNFPFRDIIRTKAGYEGLLNRYLPMIAAKCDISTRFVFYSARKTFAQLANELMIKDSIIEYCIGDAVSNRTRTIGSYISINKRIADKAIRRVFDAVASTKSMDELMEEYV